MQIKNPTKDALEIQFKGVRYAIEPEGTLDNVDESVARFWQESIHKFLILRKDKAELTSVETVEIPQPKVIEPIFVPEVVEQETSSASITEEVEVTQAAPEIKEVKINRRK